MEELNIERQMSSHGEDWPCMQLFRSTFTCLKENSSSDLSPCKETVAQFIACTESVAPLTMVEKYKNKLSKTRFLSSAEDFGRDKNTLRDSLEKVVPTVFNEEERKTSQIVETLQDSLPRIFADDEDEDEDE